LAGKCENVGGAIIRAAWPEIWNRMNDVCDNRGGAAEQQVSTASNLKSTHGKTIIFKVLHNTKIYPCQMAYFLIVVSAKLL